MSRVVRMGLFAAIAMASTAPLPAQNCPNGSAVVFVGADVLTMNDSTLFRGANVLVRAGRIVSVGSSSVPRDACRIDARGKVLLPGLADMHAHMTERDLPLFLANGVTLVREMNGSPDHLRLRAQIEAGQRLGPRLVVASPLLTGTPLRYRHRLIQHVQDAYAAAHEAKDAGYDLLKIYDGLERAEYEALVQAGRTLNMKLDGHIPADVGLERVITAGQSIQHMDKIAFALAGHSPDPGRLEEARRRFDGKRVWITPTLASLRVLDRAGTAEYAARFQRPEMAYVDSSTLAWWRSLIHGSARPVAVSPYYRFQAALLPVLKESGSRFLLGTDAANPMMIAGFSVHEELETLVADGGFSRYEALVSATRNPADFLGDSLGGRVQVGARADLLLVDANPLADLATLKQPRGVMIGGRWLDRAQLEAGLRSR